MNNVPEFDEAVVVTNVDNNVLKTDSTLNTTISATYMHYTPVGEYDVAYDIRFDRNRNELQFRQTIKGSDARFVNVIKMYYR